MFFNQIYYPTNPVFVASHHDAIICAPKSKKGQQLIVKVRSYGVRAAARGARKLGLHKSRE